MPSRTSPKMQLTLLRVFRCWLVLAFSIYISFLIPSFLILLINTTSFHTHTYIYIFIVSVFYDFILFLFILCLEYWILSSFFLFPSPTFSFLFFHFFFHFFFPLNLMTISSLLLRKGLPEACTALQVVDIIKVSHVLFRL